MGNNSNEKREKERKKERREVARIMGRMETKDDAATTTIIAFSL